MIRNLLCFSLEKIFNLGLHQRWALGPRPFDPARINRILAVRNDNVGDVLCSTPAIRSLRRAFPKAYLAGLVVGYSQDALTGNPDLDELFVYEKAKHRPDRNQFVSLYKQFQVLRKLKEKNFDLAIGLRSAFSWSEAWLVYFTAAPFRLGYAPSLKKDQRFSFFYNLRVPPPAPEWHEVERTLRLVETLGIRRAETHLFAAVPEEARREVESFLMDKGVDPNRLIGFHLSSRQPANRWSVEKFASLAARLIRQDGLSVILTWGPGDEGRAQKVKAQAGRSLLLFPTANFKMLGALQERCRVFVSSDGGAMHFSTAVGTPTVALFGETDPREWGPWGDGHVALRRGEQADMITVDEVYQSLKKWIQ